MISKNETRAVNVTGPESESAQCCRITKWEVSRTWWSTGSQVTELALHLRALGYITGGFKNGSFCFKKITVVGRVARLEPRESDSTRASEGVN